MRKVFLLFILVFSACYDLWGSAAGLSLPAAVETADLIARIRIDEDVEVIPLLTATRSDNGKVVYSTTSENPEEYRKVATASIVESFKGGRTGDQIKIRHTNGYGCPNVIYQKGTEYIVFLQKESDSNKYVTMNYYAGQFRVEGQQILGFYLMPGYKHPESGRLHSEQVTAILRAAIQKAEK